MNENFPQILISSKDDHEDKNYYHDPSITQQDGHGFRNHWNLWETIKREKKEGEKFQDYDGEGEQKRQNFKERKREREKT